MAAPPPPLGTHGAPSARQCEGQLQRQRQSPGRVEAAARQILPARGQLPRRPSQRPAGRWLRARDVIAVIIVVVVVIVGIVVVIVGAVVSI
jgi:hypothetical protein